LVFKDLGILVSWVCVVGLRKSFKVWCFDFVMKRLMGSFVLVLVLVLLVVLL